MGKFVILSGGADVSVGIGMHPVYIGRSSQNDVVLLDEDVSQRHACAWAAGGRYYIEDLHSRQGTFVDDRRIDRPTELKIGSTVRLGRNCTLRLDASGAQVDWLPYFFVESVSTGLRVPIRRRSFTLGGRGCDLRLPDAEGKLGELTLRDDGGLELVTDDDVEDIRMGQTFHCGGHELVLGRHEPKSVATTVDMRDWVWPVRVLVDATGAVRLVHEDGTGHEVRTGNRAKLVTLLAQQHIEDQREGKPRRDRGWAFDADLITAKDGRVAWTQRVGGRSRRGRSLARDQRGQSAAQASETGRRRRHETRLS